MSVKFIVHGEPRSLLRPRTKRDSSVVYDPSENTARKKDVAWVAAAAMARTPTLKGPVGLRAHFYFPIPTRWRKAKKARAEEYGIPHTQTPDLDNLIKLLCDACSGIVYEDDRQVCSILEAWKVHGDYPRTEVEFIELEAT